MIKRYVLISSGLLLIIGFTGFTLGGIAKIAQLDLFQSFVYLLLGAVGLKFGLSNTANKILARYTRAQGVVGFILLAIGLTLPNFLDLFHLEVPEHFFHGVLGLTSSLIGEHFSRKG